MDHRGLLRIDHGNSAPVGYRALWRRLLNFLAGPSVVRRPSRRSDFPDAATAAVDVEQRADYKRYDLAWLTAWASGPIHFARIDYRSASAIDEPCFPHL
jgi:hypothetical protein